MKMHAEFKSRTARRIKEELKAYIDVLISLTANFMSVLYKLVKKIS
jgi:hypothetical protein